MFSIILLNVDGEFARPKGITVNWNNAKLVMKAVFSLSSSDMSICKNPEFKSIELSSASRQYLLLAVDMHPLQSLHLVACSIRKIF